MHRRPPFSVLYLDIFRRHVDQALGLGQEVAMPTGLRGTHALRHAGQSTHFSILFFFLIYYF